MYINWEVNLELTRFLCYFLQIIIQLENYSLQYFQKRGNSNILNLFQFFTQHTFQYFPYLTTPKSIIHNYYVVDRKTIIL
jgi:hypothetical protein